MKQLGWLAGAGLLLVTAGPIAAQDPTTAPTAGDTTALVFEREVFRYPEYARRNPFASLLTSEDGPRFEQLRLLGIIYSADRSKSVAMFTDAAPEGERRPSYRLRVGDRLGTAVVLDIQPRHVVMEVTEFGLAERRTLELRPRTEGQGGPR
jgi:hypothetical protein